MGGGMSIELRSAMPCCCETHASFCFDSGMATVAVMSKLGMDNAK